MLCHFVLDFLMKKRPGNPAVHALTGKSVVSVGDPKPGVAHRPEWDQRVLNFTSPQQIISDLTHT